MIMVLRIVFKIQYQVHVANVFGFSWLTYIECVASLALILVMDCAAVGLLPRDKAERQTRMLVS